MEVDRKIRRGEMFNACGKKRKIKSYIVMRGGNGQKITRGKMFNV